MILVDVCIVIDFQIAENIAEACNILRHDQDEYALQSQIKCEQAILLGHFDTEIEPIIISTGKSEIFHSSDHFFLFVLTCKGEVEIRQDECHRKPIAMETLSRMNTLFKEGKKNEFKSNSELRII